jgi:hypothetical protein
MGFKKHGTGEVTGTEGSRAKTAGREWTDTDERELQQENEQADREED